MEFEMAVPCLLGVEGLIAQELRDMGASSVAAENGRVLFSGDENILARANIRLRCAERVQIVVGSFTATTFDELFEGTKALEWEKYIGESDAFPVKGYSLDSTLFSVSDCQSIIKKAVVERLKTKYGKSWFDESGALFQIQFSIMKDNVTLLIDTSGVGLHKRGYRPEANAAPLKETLAAALCMVSRLHDNHTLYDPMCGSGTILIEGALLATNTAPGLRRGFTCENWPIIDRRVFDEERERARALIKTDVSFRAVGSDIDGEAIEIAGANADRAGVRRYMDLEVRDIKDFRSEAEHGTLIVNPPYGERLLDIGSAEQIYKLMGQLFVKKRGWSYGIITADDDFESCFGRKADKRRKLYNGMIKCQYYMYFKP